MTPRSRICAAVLLAVLPSARAQTPSHERAPAAPKPEPTEPDLVEYIRGALLSLSPNDGSTTILRFATMMRRRY